MSTSDDSKTLLDITTEDDEDDFDDLDGMIFRMPR
jgi:hypothetical protein